MRRNKTFLILISVITLLLYLLIYLKASDIPINLLEHPLILWWTPFIAESVKVIKCESGYNCIVSKNRSYRLQPNLGAYIFYGSSFNFTDLPLPKNETLWAMIHEESPKNLPFFIYRHGQDLFDITATFSRHSDFPMPLQFLKDLSLITDTVYYMSLKEKNNLLSKNAPVLYIQSDCDTPIERDDLVKELMKYIRIDSYGKCLNNKQLSDRYNIEKTFENLYDDDFMSFIAQYKFIVAIENSICDDYITEKLWRPLIAGSIPIYLGSPSVKDWLPNNTSAILINEFKDIYNLAKFIIQVNEDDNLYNQYMQHKTGEVKITNELLRLTLDKGSYGIANNEDFPVAAFECFVCKSLHEETHRERRKQSVYNCVEPISRNKSKENWWKIYWNDGKCQAKALHYLLHNTNLHEITLEVFQEQFNKLYKNNDCN